MSDAIEIHYTEDEARALIGKTFESLVEFSGVPKGTQGLVVEVDRQGLGHWDIVIEWRGRSQFRLRDWFTKDEMRRYMKEAEPVEPTNSLCPICGQATISHTAIVGYAFNRRCEMMLSVVQCPSCRGVFNSNKDGNYFVPGVNLMNNEQIIDAVKAKRLYPYWRESEIQFSFQPLADRKLVTLDELKKYLESQAAQVAAEEKK